MSSKRQIGLGTAIKRVTQTLGIPHCKPCARRAAALDRAVPNILPDVNGLPTYLANAARKWGSKRRQKR